MATIGNLSVAVSANTRRLNRGLGRAGNVVRKFGSGIAGLAKKFGPLGAAITGVTGAAGIARLINQSFEAVDRLGKMSDTLGIATEKLAGLNRAAERSGVSSANLEKAMIRMQRRVSDAAGAAVKLEAGTSGPAANLRQLGLEIDRIASLSPEEQFLQISTAVNELPNAAERTRVAFELFGRRGVEAMRITQGGIEGAREAMAEAQRLGMAPTREEAARIEAANDAWDDMKDSIMGIANSVAIAIAPIIQSTSERMTEFGVQARGAFEAVLPIVTQFWETLKSVGSAILEWHPLISGARTLFGGVQTTFKEVRDFIIDGLAIIQFGWENIGQVVGLVWNNIQLGAVTFWEEMKFTFTERIPSVIIWFADNFREIMFTAFDHALTLFINLGKNIRALWQGVLDFIAGRGFEPDFTPLTEGAASAISDMPEIADREMSDLEKRLSKSVEDINAGLSQDLGEHLRQRRADLLGAGEDAEVEVGDPELGLGEGTEKALKELSGVGVAERGSGEAFSAIFNAMRGQADPMRSIAQSSQRQLDESRKQTRLLEKRASKPPIELVPGEV